MLLCIDIGNTNIVLGLYRGEELAAHWRIATDHQRLADEYIGLEKVGDGISSTVYYCTLLGRIDDRTGRITGVEGL